MTDISDKAVQNALEILEVAALTHDDFTASDTCAAAFATVKARIDADAKAVDALRDLFTSEADDTETRSAACEIIGGVLARRLGFSSIHAARQELDEVFATIAERAMLLWDQLGPLRDYVEASTQRADE